jgi:2'-5' RNA ligase
MTRAFVAVRLPDAVLDAVDAVVPAAEGARFTTREQRHLTLQFLGNRADVDAVADALHALAMARGDVQLGGGGAFPSARRARVFWVGVAAGGAFLSQLAAAVGALLAPLGHEPEAREYHPHVTLARWKTPTDARPAVTAIGDGAVGAPFIVEEVVLYESQLRRAGAQYVVRDVVPLV